MEMGNVSKRQQHDHITDNCINIINMSSMQRETPAPGGVLQMAPGNCLDDDDYDFIPVLM